MIRERNIVVCILLSLITCGIYGIYWFIVMTNDVVKANYGKEYQTSGGMAFLFSLITCGLYGFYWYYKIGKAVYVAQTDMGIPANDNSVLYIILGIFGFGIVAYCLIQADLNKLSNTNALI